MLRELEVLEGMPRVNHGQNTSAESLMYTDRAALTSAE